MMQCQTLQIGGTAETQTPHLAAVGRVPAGLDHVQLVQHLAHRQHAGPHCAHRGQQGAPAPAGQPRSHAQHKDQVKETHLQKQQSQRQASGPADRQERQLGVQRKVDR